MKEAVRGEEGRIKGIKRSRWRLKNIIRLFQGFGKVDETLNRLVNIMTKSGLMIRNY